MARIRIDRPLRAALLDQLVAAGVAPLTPGGTSILEPDPDGNGGWLTVPDARVATAQAVIAAHDAAALDAAAAQVRADDDDDRATLRQAVQQLLADAATLEGAGTLTVAQVRVLVARTDRALAATLKYLVRRGL